MGPKKKNQYKPNRTFDAVLCLACSFTDFILAPKKDMEVWVRQYHSWGFTNPKILMALGEHFDKNVYGIGSVRFFSS